MKLSLGSSWETPWELNFRGCRCWDLCLCSPWHSLWVLLCWISGWCPGSELLAQPHWCLSVLSELQGAVTDLQTSSGQRPELLGSFPLLPEAVTWPDVGSVAHGLEGGMQVVLLPKSPWVSKLQLCPLGLGLSCSTDQFAATALKPLWQLVATSAKAFNPGHSFQLAVADRNVPLLGFILAFNDFYVGFDGVKGIEWECFVWT